MPLFAYKCSKCGLVFEELLKKSVDTFECENCAADAKKIWHPDGPALPIFTVKGFYTTDYKMANSNPGQPKKEKTYA